MIRCRPRSPPRAAQPSGGDDGGGAAEWRVRRSAGAKDDGAASPATPPAATPPARGAARLAPVPARPGRPAAAAPTPAAPTPAGGAARARCCARVARAGRPAALDHREQRRSPREEGGHRPGRPALAHQDRPGRRPRLGPARLRPRERGHRRSTCTATTPTPTARGAVRELAKQFKASRQNAMFIVPDAPAANEQADALARALRSAARRHPREHQAARGPIVVMGHSGAFPHRDAVGRPPPGRSDHPARRAVRCRRPRSTSSSAAASTRTSTS